ncbi:MAG: hypothetical protein RL641_44 [Candidatus Parcubacteria bacterium]|jgi:hypothetical protein
MREVTIYLYELVSKYPSSPWYSLTWEKSEKYAIVVDKITEDLLRLKYEDGELCVFIFDDAFLGQYWSGQSTPNRLSSVFTFFERLSQLEGDLVVIIAADTEPLYWLVERHTKDFETIVDNFFHRALIVDNRKAVEPQYDPEPDYFLQFIPGNNEYNLRSRQILPIEDDSVPNWNELSKMKIFLIDKKN